MSVDFKIPKKLIEVALPLDAINLASGKEKSIRQGHPSTLHLWWARRPLAAARAIIFAQMVNDPGYERELGRGINKKKAAEERARLFKIIEKLVLWENSANVDLLNEARSEIEKSWIETCSLNKEHPRAKELFDPEVLPEFYDPFAGGGAIPLEAQRLGLVAYASDLNPVAVTINKAMIECPSRFANRNPVGLESKNIKQKSMSLDWSGAKGLAEDVHRYGEIVRAKVIERIGHLYPPVEVTKNMTTLRDDLKSQLGRRLPIIAWIWARTAKCENPACGKTFPMLKSLCLSKKKQVVLKPKIGKDAVTFSVAISDEEIPGNVERRAVKCWFCNTYMKLSAIEVQGRNGAMSQQLIALVAEGKGGRTYLNAECTQVAEIEPGLLENSPSCEIEHWRSCTNCVVYGFNRFEDLFLKRQMAALNAFSDAIIETRNLAVEDAFKSGLKKDGVSLFKNGNGAEAYADAVALYLTCALDKTADYNSSSCSWISGGETMRNTFARQALPMVWDFAEANPIGESTGSFASSLSQVCKVLKNLGSNTMGYAVQADAVNQEISNLKVISTDPPYYDNIPYSNLSDFFYMWMRRVLKFTDQEMFKETSVPRKTELVANKHRHGSKKTAEAFFLNGMQEVMTKLQQTSHPAFPVTIYYAFKQTETDQDGGISSTGWETFLSAIINSGFSISGTWPIRTELSNRMLGTDSNALASSVVLVCNRRPQNAVTVSRRDFIRELNLILPVALEEMTAGVGQHSPVAPVDLSQAIIGPGMAIFSRYSAVLEADGKAMTVKSALQLINRFLSEDDFDNDTQFCLQWFDSHGWENGRFGQGDVLARAKGTSVHGLSESGIAALSSGNIRLLKPNELPNDWTPQADSRISVWEILHHMIRRLNGEGEVGAGELLSRVGQFSERIRSLAYRLYTLCERKSWSQDANLYDQLVRAWDGIEAAASAKGYTESQISLFGEDQLIPNDTTKSRRKTRKLKQ